jgi:hypothetical protein
MTTPTLEAHINRLIDQRLRQMQTAFPAEVVDFNQSESTVTVKPLFIETWRGPGDVRTKETIENDEDAYVENVLVMFPRASTFRVTFPITAGDTGLVVCTKFSLDRFRDGGGMSDPGDLRKFTMSGSVFFPVNLTPDADPLDGSESGSTDIYLGEGATGDYLALKKDVDDIKSFIDNFQSTYNAHTHTAGALKDSVSGACTGLTGTASSHQSSESYTPTYSADVKVESN